MWFAKHLKLLRLRSFKLGVLQTHVLGPQEKQDPSAAQ